MSTYLVVGANGTVAHEVARLLEAAGHVVRRGTSRAAGAGQVHIDLVSGAGIDDALRGVDGAFVFAPPGYTNQDVLLPPVFAAAQRLGVRKVVMMSAMGADASDEAPMRKAELALERSGVAWNVIRPNWFMQNFHTFWLHGITHHNAVQLPVGDARTSFIDARDIAAVAAALLQRADFDNQAFDLTGGASLTHAEVAAILSRELDRPIRFEDITSESMRPGLLAAGLPADYVEFLLLILSYLKAGYAERTTDAVERITGRAPRTFEAYARDFRAAYPSPVAA
ncbi:MAG: NAD(P)H-binding protein [Gemmatimonadaceae bacterium]|nr:NAD(P)H-binding protein [Gemmatimonadaceae bacterium]